MNNLRPRYWIPVADTFRVIVVIVLAIIIILLLLRACNTVTPTIVGPSAGVQAGQPIDLSGLAPPNAVVRVFDGNTLISETTADASGNWKLALPAGLGVGAHELTARVFRDNAQVGSSMPLNLSIAALPATPAPTVSPTPTLLPVPTAPPPTINYPAPGAALTSGSLGKITGSASPGSRLQILDGDQLLGEVTADSSGKWSWGLPASLAAGAHTLIVKTLLSDGKALVSSPLNITIEAPRPTPTPVTPATNTPIEAPTILPIANGQLGIGAAVKGKAKPGSVVSIFDGDKLLGTATADADGGWAFTLPMSLQAGVVNLRAAILDSTGAVLSQSQVTRVRIVPVALPASGGARPGP